jgi:carbonic anhydrase/acetyltransferase-like protein (isoleucine patch superfamily)
MSKPLLSALVAFSLVAVPVAAHAGDEAKKADPAKKSSTCTISIKQGDLIAQGKNLVVEGQDSVRDALAFDGNVVVRAGATVNKVAAVRGKVTVEAGARVAGDVSAVGGDVHIQKGATIAGDVNVIGGKLQVDEGSTIAGEKNHLSININGEEFISKLIGDIITGTGTTQCQVRITEE